MRGYPDLVGGRLLRVAARAAAAQQGAVAAGAGQQRLVSPAATPSVSTPADSPPRSLSASFSEAGPVWRPPLSSSFVSEDGGWGTDEEEREEEEEEEERGVWYGERVVFGPAPSGEEVAEAVSTLQQVFVPFRFSQDFYDGFPSNLDTSTSNETSLSADTANDFSSAASRPEWVEPAVQLPVAKSDRYQGKDRLLDAFHSLQINPSIQRMVVSLSSDKAVWDAVMGNDAVKELKESFNSAENDKTAKSGKGPNVAAQAARQILKNAKVKLMDFVERITKLLNQFIHPHEKSKTDAFEDAVRSSFTMSLVVIAIVVIFRVHRS